MDLEFFIVKCRRCSGPRVGAEIAQQVIRCVCCARQVTRFRWKDTDQDFYKSFLICDECAKTNLRCEICAVGEVEPNYLRAKLKIQQTRCKFFTKGSCLKGRYCRFSHASVPASASEQSPEGDGERRQPGFYQAPCKYFLRGRCARGDTCPFVHVSKEKKGDENNSSGGEDDNKNTAGDAGKEEDESTAQAEVRALETGPETEPQVN